MALFCRMFMKKMFGVYEKKTLKNENVNKCKTGRQNILKCGCQIIPNLVALLTFRYIVCDFQRCENVSAVID